MSATVCAVLAMAYLLWNNQSNWLDLLLAPYRTSSSTPTATPKAAGVVVPHPTSHELERAELRARLILTETGLDMCGEIHISRTPDEVRIEGQFPSSGQQRRARSQLAAIDRVHVDLHAGSRSNTSPDQVASRAATIRPGLDVWLTRTFIDPVVCRSFPPDLMRSISTVRQRLTLLDALARRYPDARHQLSRNEFDLLQQLVELHYHKLHPELDALRARISLMAGSDSLVLAASACPAGWLPRTAMAHSHAITLERQLQNLLRQHDLTTTDQQNLRTTFHALWTSVYAPQAHASNDRTIAQ